jgi:hypothetical protein
MKLSKKVKTALDETRLLILGAQVLFGFELSSVFQDAFSEFSQTSRLLACAGQVLMALSIALLIAPSMQHRIVEGGQDTIRIHSMTSLLAGLGLLPFVVSLAIGIYLIFDRVFGGPARLIAAALCCALAASSWYGLEFWLKGSGRRKTMQIPERPTPLPQRIEQMLTEARIIVPGVQALFGFQFTMTLTHVFDQLPYSSKLIHVAALCCVVVAVILLMTPAALHRIAYGGEDTPEFFRLGSGFVIVAPAPLALAIGGDLYVAIAKASDSTGLAATLAVTVFAALAGLWYALPLALRYNGGLAALLHVSRARPPSREDSPEGQRLARARSDS